MAVMFDRYLANLRRVKNETTFVLSQFDHVFRAVDAEDQTGKSIVIQENIVLFIGASIGDVRAKAESRGRRDESLSVDSGLHINDVPVRMVFGGVRQIVEADFEVISDGEALPAFLDSCEISYSEYRLQSIADLANLIDGKAVDVKLADVAFGDSE